jgi:hypothetical protein
MAIFARHPILKPLNQGSSDGLPTSGGDAITYRHMVSLSGQSNSSPGSGGSPALSTSQPYDNLRRSGTTAIPLVETTVETLASGFANWLSFHEDGRDVIIDGWGVGGTAYSGLAQGTGPYNTGLTGVLNSRTAVAALRPTETFRCSALLWVHGETDDFNGVSANTYQGYMETQQANWQADNLAALGANYTIPMILTQHASNSRLVSAFAANVPMGQEQAARSNPGQIFLSHPTYHIPYNTNDVHYTNVGHRRNGEYLAKAFYQIVRQNAGFIPLRPSTITATNNVVTINFEGGYDDLPIVFDTTNMAAKPNMGFEYTDSQADIPAITSVAITGDRQVQLTLNRNAQGTARVRYAYSCVPFTDAGPTALGGIGGNLRDQDPTPSRITGQNPLWNWCVGFDRSVTSITGSASAAQTFTNTQSVDGTGTNAFLSARNITALDGAANVSWSWWQRGNAATWPGSDQVVFTKNATSNRQFDFRKQAGGGATGTMRFYITNGLTGLQYADYTGFSAQTWQHIVVTFAAGVVVVYRNGVALTPSSTSGTFPAVLSSGSLADVEILAGSGGTGSCNQNMSHIAIWIGTALTAVEVGLMYNAGVPTNLRSTGGVTVPTHYWMLQGNYENVGNAANADKRNLLPYGNVSFEAIAP